MAAIMETSLLAQNKGTYDLSEEHLSYFFSNRQNDPLGNTPDDKNYVLGNYHVIGGNDHLAAIYLSTWSGMTTEADVPFPTDSSHQNDLTVQIPESKAYNSAAYLKNASVSKYSEERMKEMLLNDHAVSIMLYMKESYANPDTAAYCYPVGKSNSTVINHIVTVVGWDDTYSKDNFLPVSNVTSDGAWIIKNSWGEKKGDGGYYYLSYQDPNISKLVSAEAVAASDQKYRNNYFYDGSSALSVIPIQAGQSVAAVYETTAGKGKAEVLGEVNLVTNSDNACYKIQIYTDLTDPYAFLQGLKNMPEVSDADYYKFFAKVEHVILNRYGCEVSGGERAEFNLLQEINDAYQYDMLLIDEPESSFDNIFLRERVNHIIKDISQQLPVVIVTHNSTVGASIHPDFVVNTVRTIDGNTAQYDVYYGFPGNKELTNKAGKKIKNLDAILNCLEAGEVAYDERRREYEMLKN